MADAFPAHDGDPLKILAILVREEMGLKQDQVVIYNQEFQMPPDDRLYASLSIFGSKTFGVEQSHETTALDPELREVQTTNRQELISVMLYSSTPEARIRSWEIPLVFTSDRAQQAMEARSFTMGRLPLAMTDVSEQDGAKRLNRFSFTFSLLVAYEKRKPVQYFDKFQIPPLITANQ